MPQTTASSASAPQTSGLRVRSSSFDPLIRFDLVRQPTWKAPFGRYASGAVLLLCALLSACRPPQAARSDSPSPDDPSGAAELSYVTTPQVLQAQLGRNGALMLAGVAAPGALIRLQAPEGDSLTAQARRDGRWTLRAPPVERPRMFALSASSADGRIVHAEGALILSPPPAPPALLARAGYGALVMAAPVQRVATKPLDVVAIDYDPSGFVAVSGLAAPRAEVRLVLDGAPAGLTHADGSGRFAVLAAGRRMSFAPHVATVQTVSGSVTRGFRLVPPASLGNPYQATPSPEGWQVEWALPGGGVQTTLVFASPATARAGPPVVRPDGSR